MQISDVLFDPGELRLPEDEVHLWSIDLGQVAVAESRWRSLLSQDEISRAQRLKFADDRQRFTATRGLLRILLAAYAAAQPRELTFVYGQNQKPFLGPIHDAGRVQFNVSHSGTKALIAITRGRELGVDIEQVRQNVDYESLARRFFSLAERTALSSLEPCERYRAFFRCWTRKEAYIKAHGAGLALPLQTFDVSVSAGEENALLATRPGAKEAALWSIRPLEAGEGYEAALCARGSNWIVKSKCAEDFPTSIRTIKKGFHRAQKLAYYEVAGNSMLPIRWRVIFHLYQLTVQ